MKITKGTIIRTVLIMLVLLNRVLQHFGLSVLPVDENAIAEAVNLIIEILAVLAAWWYNNSFSSAAKKADVFLNALREEEKNV